jgi:outer membrane receptor protein involved in Fe transport
MGLRRQNYIVGFVCAALTMLGCASADASEIKRIDIRRPLLKDALSELAEETGAELLFSENLVGKLSARRVNGRLTVAQTLSLLLEGSGVGYRVTPDHAFVLFALPPDQVADPGDGAVAELLVVGRKTQNADIRRTENDIQPYRIAGPRDLQVAQNDNLDQFTRSRLPANAQVVPRNLNILTLLGANNSAIDLRGLGTGRTLVLIDGRRIPSSPSGADDFEQGDLNGVPLGAIERIETLTSTAGGIYGPSAIGGVVNVVLRRDYRGGELSVASGVTDRGDAKRARVEGRFGFTPDHGDTDVMLFGAYAKSQPLYSDKRDFSLRALQRRYANDPQAVLASRPVTNAISVFSGAGPLRFDPAYGGGVLSSGYTFLPLDFAGTDAEALAVLAANDGKISLGSPPGQTSLMVTPTVGSALVNVRRRLNSSVEGFIDGIYFDNRGVVRISDGGYAGAATTANAPSNPFAQSVFFRYPTPGAVDTFTRYRLSRMTVGLIASLRAGWRASADVATGRATYKARGEFPFVETADVQSGRPGANGQPAIFPLKGELALNAALSAYNTGATVTSGRSLQTKFRNATVRAAGPVVSLPGGPLTATILGEFRRERIPPSEGYVDLLGARLVTYPTPERGQRVMSAYFELRAPLGTADSVIAPLRGLELQLAVRHDSLRTRFPEDATAGQPSNDRLQQVGHEATMFTAGARMLPAAWLMFRGSVATGQVPPTLVQLQSTEYILTNPGVPSPDPRRPGRNLYEDGSYLILRGGSHHIKTERGRTISLGAVLNPAGRTGPRVSVDYSRIDTTREIVDFMLNGAELVANEAAYPDRVIRAPVTAADAALGLTVGRVLVLDLGAINAGRSVMEAVDLELDWSLPASKRGQARLYGGATWQPTLRRRARPGETWVERVGYADGPSAWRGNIGAQWIQGPLTLDLNLQHYGGYRVAESAVGANVAGNAQAVRYQGSGRIPAQAYIDLAARRRFEFAAGHGLLQVVEARLGVQNLLDHSPPIIADPRGLAYSSYGDPRRRRFELLLSAKF